MRRCSKTIRFLNHRRQISTTGSCLKILRLPRELLYAQPDQIVCDEQVDQKFTVAGDSDEKITHNRHPGRYHIGVVTPPRQFEAALIKVAGAANIESLKIEAKKIYDSLHGRQLPIHESTLYEKVSLAYKEIVREFTEKCQPKNLSGTPPDEEIQEMIENKHDHFMREARKRVQIYSWRQSDYKSTARCLSYGVARFAADYSILCRVFREIKLSVPNFKPETFFDFGSGIGTTIWAAEKIFGSMNENPNPHIYSCVDTCPEMIDTAERLLAPNGSDHPLMPNVNAFFRQFLPVQHDPKHDIVVCAFSLMELPSYESRLATIENLWQKTGRFLVLVETGNRYGFTALAEARDHILTRAGTIDKTETLNMFAQRNLDCEPILKYVLNRKELSPKGQLDLLDAHLKEMGVKNFRTPTLLPQGRMFAPCPHDFACPRVQSDILPCKFEQKFFQLRLTADKTERLGREFFSYLVLEKNPPAGYDEQDEFQNRHSWPRLLKPVLSQKKVALCEMCTPQGLLSETKCRKLAHGENAYRMLRRSDWGDQWPVALTFDQDKLEKKREKALRWVQEKRTGVKEKVSEDSEEESDQENSDSSTQMDDDDLFDGFDDTGDEKAANSAAR